MVPDDPASTQSDPETSQMPAVPPARSEPDPVVWPEDPWVADGRAAEDPTLEGGPPMVTTPVIPTWPESSAGEPSVPSHASVNPTANDPETAPFPTQRAGLGSDSAVMKTAPPQPAAPPEAPEPTEELHDTVPPTPAVDAVAPAESAEVETVDAALETVPPELEAVEASDVQSTSPPAGEADAEAEEATPAPVGEEETPAPIEATAAEAEPEAEAAPEAAAEPEPEAEPVTEPEPAPEPIKAEEPEPPAPEEAPVEPATPAAGTPAWAGQAATPTTPAPASPFSSSGPVIPSWAPNAPAAAAKPQPDAPTQWPGINVPAWAPQPTVSHPGTANPLPGAASPYVEPVRTSQPAPAPAPAPAQASTPPPAPPAPAPTPTTSAPPVPKTSSWEVVEQKRAAEPKHQGPTPEDKSYAEWFAWAKRSGAPASACHAAAQGAFRALAAGHDMNTAVQWATLAMASPPGLVGQSRQLYCAWYSLGNIDLKLPTAQAHAFANGAVQALEEGADSMGAHQAGLLAAGITGG